MKYLDDGPMTFAGGFGPGPRREFCSRCDKPPSWCECPRPTWEDLAKTAVDGVISIDAPGARVDVTEPLECTNETPCAPCGCSNAVCVCDFRCSRGPGA